MEWKMFREYSKTLITILIRLMFSSKLDYLAGNPSATNLNLF